MTSETFANALENRILLFDGAMGTEIQKMRSGRGRGLEF